MTDTQREKLEQAAEQAEALHKRTGYTSASAIAALIRDAIQEEAK